MSSCLSISYLTEVQRLEEERCDLRDSLRLVDALIDAYRLDWTNPAYRIAEHIQDQHRLVCRKLRELTP